MIVTPTGARGTAGEREREKVREGGREGGRERERDLPLTLRVR